MPVGKFWSSFLSMKRNVQRWNSFCSVLRVIRSERIIYAQ
ncbi:hypothetical protein HMPREF1619_01584 [Klebsiella pneumoniae 909957]|nr:hypothetical protein HMPREF1619_01584 [Klebsiella pneumoniae 909957]